jgi:membrane protease YdiL (CAAX protease family)
MDMDNGPLSPPPAQAPESNPPPRKDSALPDDLRVPWTWLDLALLGILTLAGSVLLTLGLGRVFMSYGVTPARLRASPALFGLLVLIHQLLLFALLLAYLFAQLRVSFRVPFWRTIGWRALEPGPIPRVTRYLGVVFGGFLLAVLVESVSLRFGTKAKLPVQQLFQDPRVATAVALMAVLVAPWVEETIFRGYIYPVVARSYGVAVGVLGTGILFGLLHAPQLWGGWVQISLLVLVGIVLTYVRAATRTVLASFLVHLSYNCSVSFALAILARALHLLSPHH